MSKNQEIIKLEISEGDFLQELADMIDAGDLAHRPSRSAAEGARGEEPGG